MLTKNQCVSLMIAGLTLFGVGATVANAVEQRAAKDVPIDELIRETQRTHLASNSIDLAWWIPWEYWKVTLSHSKQMSSAGTQSFESKLRPLFMIAVVQADTSPLGNFDFFSEQTVQNSLRVTYINRDGKAIPLTPVEKIDGDISLLKQIIRPILSKALGNVGSNFWFFVYSDVDSSGKRIISPYEPGELRVVLADKSSVKRSDVAVELPLNSLFVPRLCPNGKPAHISWKYCPWDGTRLSN